MSKNAAYVFVKPHAHTEATVALVKKKFDEVGITILKEEVITAEKIDSDKLIDQHYYAIASKATIMKPADLPVPKEKFKAQFDLEWDAALADGKVFNAMDGMAKLGLDLETFTGHWDQAKKDGKIVKLGGGFYCAYLSTAPTPIYVFNGFFMSMREKFTAKGTSIYAFSVEFDPKVCSWEKFRGEVLGPTDPATAPPGSLRGIINATWQDLGQKTAPNVGDNGVHASASPFEGLAERLNWLGASLADDSFGGALLKAGLDEATIKAWSVDPQVTLDADGAKGSIFDALEDLDVDACIEKCVAIFKCK